MKPIPRSLSTWHHTEVNTSSNSTIIARSPDTDVLVLLISRTQGLALKELFDNESTKGLETTVVSLT